METPTTPSPHVSDNESDEEEMETGEEEDLLASPGHRHHDSSEDRDGFQHI